MSNVQPIVSDIGLKAFVVTTDWCEVSVLTFSTSHSKAKSAARYTSWLGDSEWVDLRCRREPRCDKYGTKFGAGPIECDTKEEMLMLRGLGWYEVEGNMDECRDCGLYEWGSLPESTLEYEDEDDPICHSCKQETAGDD